MIHRKKEWLKKHYIERGMSMSEMAKIAGVDVHTIRNNLKANEIKVRSRSEAGLLSYKKNKRPKGKEHHFYKRKKSDEHIENIRKAISREGNETRIAQGYIAVKVRNHPNAQKGGYVRKHRLVVEESIGRFLDSEEVVHHINGNKKDNTIENLHLFKSENDHAYFHAMKKSGHEIELEYDYGIQTKKECIICNKKFTVTPYESQTRKTCSKECGHKSRVLTRKRNLGL